MRQGDLDVEDMDEGIFFSSVKIRNRSDNFYWEVINVYGPVKHELKDQFLHELYKKIQDSDVPLMVGGDFNMIIYAHEKNTGSNYTLWMDMFNYFINDSILIEIFRGGSMFT
jgi:hypothetical protein